MTEKILPYDRAVVPQETGYWCGPASTQVVLNSRGILWRESDLAREIGTTTRGTDYIGLIERVLDRVTPDAVYSSVYTERDPMSVAQKDKFWADLVRSIDAGYGVVANIVAPPRNKPRGVKGSVSPSYSGGTTYHYIALMGYDDVERAVWVADSGFRPFGYWCSFDQMATLVPPKGYCFAATLKPGTPTLPTTGAPVSNSPTPAQTPPVALLSKAMFDTLSLSQYAELLPYVSDALVKAKCNNNNRAAMFLAQVGHESVSLKFMRELWGPTADQKTYQGRMGNNNPGDGERYKGRGPMQVTGKDNYRKLSLWAFEQGYVPTATFFVDSPEQLEQYKFAFLGAIWYWTVAQPKCNQLADAGNVEDVSKLINAPAWVGTSRRANGIDDRIMRWNRCRAMDLTPLLGGDAAFMAVVDDVQLQFWNDKDKIKVYEGAGKAEYSWAKETDAGWWAWDLRGWIRQLTWDLLRFQKPIAAKVAADLDLNKTWGLRDQVNRIHLLQEQNNWMLRKLCGAAEVDLAGLPGA